MSKDKYRIISLYACDIYAEIQKNGKDVGVSIANDDKEGYYKAFNAFLDFSLDSIKLKEVFESKLKEKFYFKDKRGVLYTKAVINVDFSFVYEERQEDSKSVNKVDSKNLRKILYMEGFMLDGRRYVRYKRSAGSSRDGRCLFILEELLLEMEKWGECGLDKNNGDLASWEAYKALSLSSIKEIVKIPIEGILFVDDYVDEFEEEVVAVRYTNKKIESQVETTRVKNNIWDGESLLDESIFNENFPSRHMLLLRNKFFKSCAFKTKIQQWFADNGITNVEQLRKVGGYTLATDVSQIVMITTTSSLKYLKFSKYPLSMESIQEWRKHVDDEFGVVKVDKRTRFFNGDMVRANYQFLNTIGLQKKEVEGFIDDNVWLLRQMREDPAIMGYYFSDLSKKEGDWMTDENEVDEKDNDRADIVFSLMEKNGDFWKTKIYQEFRDSVTENTKDQLVQGHFLIDGTNATLFGNGPELLKRAIGTFNREEIALGKGEIRCAQFRDGRELLCSRSPHITMGNLYLAKNKLGGDIWKYFEIGTNVVCVNAIGENLQSRLNGCDYDSDTMLITSNSMLIEVAKRYYEDFKVPVCLIPEEKGSGKSHSEAEVDALTSQNKIGEIVNLSQRLNSILWNTLNESKNKDIKEVMPIYNDICALAVLSGIEIDKAKRNYAVQSGSVLEGIRKKYQSLLKEKPLFFKKVDDKNQTQKKTDGKEKPVDLYKEYHTAMDYIYSLTQEKGDFRKGRVGKKEEVSLSKFFGIIEKPSRQDYNIKNKIIEILEEYEKAIKYQQARLRTSRGDKEVIREDISLIIKEREEEVLGYIKNERILKLVLNEIEKKNKDYWIFYSILLSKGNPYLDRLLISGGETYYIYEDDRGDITLCGHNFSKAKR